MTERPGDILVLSIRIDGRKLTVECRGLNFRRHPPETADETGRIRPDCIDQQNIKAPFGEQGNLFRAGHELVVTVGQNGSDNLLAMR